MASLLWVAQDFALLLGAFSNLNCKNWICCCHNLFKTFAENIQEENSHEFSFHFLYFAVSSSEAEQSGIEARIMEKHGGVLALHNYLLRKHAALLLRRVMVKMWQKKMLHNIKNFSGGGRGLSERKKLCETLAQQTGNDKRSEEKSNSWKDNEKLYGRESFSVRGCFLRSELLSNKQFQFQTLTAAERGEAVHFSVLALSKSQIPPRIL